MEEPLPRAIDRIAEETPEKILFSIPRTGQQDSDHFETQYTDISYATFARSVDRFSWWLAHHLGQSQTFETIAYSGPFDLRQLIVVLAALKTGYKSLQCHDRTSDELYLGLLPQLKCKVFLLSENPTDLARSVQRLGHVPTLTVPSLESLLSEDEEPKFPYSKSAAEARGDPFIISCSSGSTGQPKPITILHGSVMSLPRTLKSRHGFDSVYEHWVGLRVFWAVPLTQAIGVHCTLAVSVYLDYIAVIPPSLPRSIQQLSPACKHARPQVIVASPLTLEGAQQDDRYLQILDGLKFLVYCGGPCSVALGEYLSKKIHFLTLLGSTETGPVSIQLLDTEDWEYIKISDDFPHQMDHTTEDLHELVISRSTTSSKETSIQPIIFSVFPDLTYYRTKDLFSRHPVKTNLWRHRGRIDDLIQVQTADTNSLDLMYPGTIEQELKSSPLVKYALVIGSSQHRPALLIEPSQVASELPSDVSENERIGSAIWPLIDSINQKAQPSHRIHKHMIMLTKPEKPMVLNYKGYLARKKTIDLYQADIDSLGMG